VWGGETVGAVAGVASMVVGVVAGWLAWAALRGAGGPAELTPAGMADQIAVAVRRRWEAEVELRRVNDPYTIPVRWEAADPDLFADWAVVERAASSAGWPEPDRSRWASGPEGLAGSGDDVSEVLERVPTGRLVVLGEPGAGKTILAVRLVLDLLTRRTSGGPLPVLVPLAAWDPAPEHLWEWLERQLCLDHPALREPAPGGDANWARALWDAGLLLPVLDGLDEINGPAQGRALAHLNEALRPGVGLVLTARTDSYRLAVRPGAGMPAAVPSGAAGVELCPLDAGTVADYLRASAGGRDAEARWEQVFAALADPAQPVGQALVTPLTAALARTVYCPRPGEPAAGLPHPGELLGRGLDSRAAVERHLFDGFLPAAYRPHADPARRGPWKASDAYRWLAFLAGQLKRRETTDLAWWELHTAAPRILPGLTGGLVFGLAAGLAYGLWAGLPLGVRSEDALGRLVVRCLVFGLDGAFTFGLAYGLVFGLVKRPSQPARGLRWSLHMGRFVLVGGLVGGLVGIPNGLVSGLVVGLVSGLMFGFVFGLASGLVFGGVERASEAERRPRWSPDPAGFVQMGIFIGGIGGVAANHADPQGGLAAGMAAGIAVGLWAWLVIRIMAGLEPRPVEPAEATDPHTVLRRDRGALAGILLVVALTAVLTERLGFLLLIAFVAAAGVDLAPLVDELVTGLMAGLAAGIVAGIARTAWGPFALAKCWLALRGRLPWRLMRFLADAHRRGVLRQAGAVYQFRHVELQRHLAGRP
jgi:hypothetical protein